MKVLDAGEVTRTKTVYAMGPFRLDVDENVLLRGPEPAALGRRGVALLHTLILQPGTLVSKQALMDAVWGEQAVEESNLTVQIAALRRALGDEPGGEDWIQTHAGRGYRFVGPAVLKEEIECRSAGARPTATAGPPASTVSKPGAVAERRQLTIMACELAGDGLADGIDVEEMRDVVAEYRQHIAGAVTAFDGYVARHVNTTVLVYFGYPTASEHNADRAIRAGLELCQAAALPSVRFAGDLRSRIAIATGEVIVDEITNASGTTERNIVGPAATT